jgi:hypothetical protein
MTRPREDEQADALEKELGDDDRRLLDSIADGIVKRKLTPAALFFLESMKPLNFIAASAMIFLRPVVQTVSQNPITWDRVSKILERRGGIELLLRRLEARS